VFDRWVRIRDWALRMIDVIPGLRRLVTELVRVEIINRAMIIAAQGLLALVPLLIVLAAFLPHDLGVALAHRFESVTGVGQASSSSVQATLQPDQVRDEFGTLGLLITIFSATSFARSIQRMYERVWDCGHVGGIAGNWRCLSWLIGWVLLLQLIALLGALLRGVAGGDLVRFVVQCVGGVLLWWWSSWALLLGRKSWRMLLPGALITGIGLVVYSTASGFVMPRYASSSAEQLGSLGLVLAATTWLIGLGFVLVVAAVLGRVLAEETRVHDAVKSLRVWRWWASHKLDQQQHQERNHQHHQGEGTGRVGGHDVDQQGETEHGHA
jgi:membrane protein